jgi:methylmalonyl-CoA mutase
VIPRQDYDELKKDGAAGIFGPGSNIIECANKVLDEIEKK